MPELKTIELPFPPSVNHYWRSTVVNGRPRVLISKPGRAYRSEVRARVLEHLRSMPDPLTGRVSLEITAFPPDRRKRDLDNMIKAVQDSLTYAGVWLDDSQIDVLKILRGNVEAGGCVLVTIKELAEA